MIYNVKLIIEFNGSGFSGWQVQNNNPKENKSIQKILEDVLKNIYKNQNIKLNGSSRTDSNVNAKRFCANFFAPFFIPENNLKKAINATVLSITRKIKIKSLEYLEKIDSDFVEIENINTKDFFHARYNSKGKVYIYKIFNGKESEKSVFDEFSYPIGNKISHKKIIELKDFIKKFEGEHNFVGFSLNTENKNKICNLKYVSLRSFKDNRNLYIIIKGDRFLHKMIRFIVGAIIQVGLNSLTKEEVLENLKLGVKKNNIKVVSGNGLFLQRVYY
jgi:tRNA pseudouridine38-40 synthase